MFPILEDIGRQVTKYSSVFGQFWYLIVFGFRLIVVTSIGSSVYGDENGGFVCATKDSGCESLCYDSYARISHMRLWAFQIMAVATPTVFFHFYVSYVETQVGKIEKVQGSLEKNNNNSEHEQMDPWEAKKLKVHNKRVKSVGKVKIKTYVRGSTTEEVLQTGKIKVAYMLNLVSRLAAEIAFAFLTFQVLLVENRHEPGSSRNLVWTRVPKSFECYVNGDVVLERACGNHLHGFVRCFIARPTEKTYFVRYMNVTSAVCLILTSVEILLFVFRLLSNGKAKRSLRSNQQQQQQQYQNSKPIKYEDIGLEDVTCMRRETKWPKSSLELDEGLSDDTDVYSLHQQHNQLHYKNNLRAHRN